MSYLNMKIPLAVVGVIAATMVGCSTRVDTPSTQTAVSLNQGNYRIVKAGAIGKSKGFRLLGILPFWSASYSKARANLYKNLGTEVQGKPTALANTTQDKSGVYFILGYVPIRTVQADVIEYIDPNHPTVNMGPVPSSTSPPTVSTPPSPTVAKTASPTQ
ncbi:MAG: hypothetical protein NTZ38_01525 [Candidatus Taylorbacteria bacterium]|nr:hypothetical protein [Candidatus Taylorbacteria bacterium]